MNVDHFLNSLTISADSYQNFARTADPRNKELGKNRP